MYMRVKCSWRTEISTSPGAGDAGIYEGFNPNSGPR